MMKSPGFLIVAVRHRISALLMSFAIGVASLGAASVEPAGLTTSRLLDLQSDLIRAVNAKDYGYVRKYIGEAEQSACLSVVISGRFLRYHDGLDVAGVQEALEFSRELVYQQPGYFSPEFVGDIASAIVRNEQLLAYFRSKNSEDTAVARAKYTLEKAIDKGESSYAHALTFFRSCSDVLAVRKGGKPLLLSVATDMSDITLKFIEVGNLQMPAEVEGRSAHELAALLRDGNTARSILQSSALMSRLCEVAVGDYAELVSVLRVVDTELAGVAQRRFVKGMESSVDQEKRTKMFHVLTAMFENEPTKATLRELRFLYWLRDVDGDLAQKLATAWISSRASGMAGPQLKYARALADSFR